MLFSEFHFYRLGFGVCLLVGLLGLCTAASAQLNDTGVTRDDGLGADHQYGRDAAANAGVLPKTGSGAKGFDFTKIANDGSDLPDTASLGTNPGDWACTRDNVTGLIWEVKTDEAVPDLRDKDWTYTWYDTNTATNGGNAGTQDGGTCFEEATRDCDIQGYAQDVNAIALCNFTDWRTPTREELRSIVDYGIASPGPNIDTAFFPNTPQSFFWSASGFARNSDGAWNLGFSNGNDGIDFKGNAKQVRLVRGGQ